MPNFTLSRQSAGLLVVDIQDKVFAAVDRVHEVLPIMLKVIRGFQILKLPIVISEQYPQGLGETLEPIQEVLGESYQPRIKSTFSCMDDAEFSSYLLNLPIQQWVLIGIEAHICVLQTAKGLVNVGKQVVVLNNAITSRSIYDFSTAIAEMRDDGVRISSMETILFELMRDSQAPEFKQISQLVKTCFSCAC
jgi:nicotinamidase-related amidase